MALIGIDYYKAIQGSLGVDSLVQNEVRSSQAWMRDELVQSLNYDELNATRNGVQQGFLVTTTEYGFQAQVRALPGDELYIGDIIGFRGEHWIVTDLTPVNPFYRLGIMKLCNYVLRFQNFSPTVYERYVFIDGGAYATYVKGDTRIQYGNEKATIYLPYDEATKKLYIDKRISVGTLWSKENRAILQCNKIIGVDYRSVSRGAGAHLMLLHIEQDAYSEEKDNIDLDLCDFITLSDDSSTEGEDNKSCKIAGTSSIMTGFSRTLTAKFFRGDELVEHIHAMWTISGLPEGITYRIEGDCIVFRCADKPELIGESFTVELTDGLNQYGTYKVTMEVTS